MPSRRRLDNPQATLAKLRNGTVNKSDLPGGVLLNRKFHYAPAAAGQVEVVMDKLRASKKAASAKPAILLATDGESIAAEHPKSGETLHCAFGELGTRFAFFLPAAGKDRYQAAEENPVDIKATGKLAKLYNALLKTNPNWATPERRHDMNLFMTRLIFCLFAEDVGVFPQNQFSQAIFSFSGDKGEHARDVLVQAFRAMNLPKGERPGPTAWTAPFEYVNGGLFAGAIDAPVFDPLAFRYLRDAANLNWKLINPDIFGSMIQSIADAGTRSELGMHYTSVPNIMKVLGPLFLDDLDAAIEKAWDRPAPLRVQLARLSKIRVFDPACGSGNFLVVAYRELREREIRIVKQLGELEANPQNVMWSSVSLGQFHGIEIADFAAETAKLALFIAEYQANARFADVFGRMPALLPLRDGGHIVCGNALELDWECVCPRPSETEEVYIAGNPPFAGAKNQSQDQKVARNDVFEKRKIKGYKTLDLVAAWFLLASDYTSSHANVRFAFVATSSVTQGRQVPSLWPHILKKLQIFFAHRPFKWRNNATDNAAVDCVIVGVSARTGGSARIFDGETVATCDQINAYLIPGPILYVNQNSKSLFGLPQMIYGAMPNDGGGLILSADDKNSILSEYPGVDEFVRPFVGTTELINSVDRYCIWINDAERDRALEFRPIADKVEATKRHRLSSKNPETVERAQIPPFLASWRAVKIALNCSGKRLVRAKRGSSG